MGRSETGISNPKRGKRSELSAKFHKEISEEVVSNLLKDNCQSLMPPTIDGLRLLAQELYFARERIKLERNDYKVFYEQRYQVQEAMTTLKAVVPLIAERFGNGIVIVDESASESDLSDLAEKYLDEAKRASSLVDNLLTTISAIEVSPNFMLPVGKPSEMPIQDKWPDIVLDIRDAYREALKPTNPASRLAIHGQGPGGRFIAAAISYVTGETVTPNTVQKKVTELQISRNEP